MKRRILIILVFIIVITTKLVSAEEKKGVEILTLGKGQCIVIKYETGKGIIAYDVREYNEYICKCLNKEKIGSIDFLILHKIKGTDIEYVKKLSEEFNIKKTYLVKNKNINREDFQDRSNNIEVVDNGWSYKNKDIDLNLIPPIDGKKQGVDSVLLYGKIDGLNYLFSGDLNKEDQKLMLQYNLIPEANILNMKNYDGKTTKEFIDKVKPKVAILHDDKLKTSRYQSGDNLRIGGAKIYSTYDSGDILIERGKDEGGIEVKTTE